MDNARYFESSQAAILMKNDCLQQLSAKEIISDFLENPEKFREMGNKMRILAVPDASERMIGEISCRID